MKPVKPRMTNIREEDSEEKSSQSPGTNSFQSSSVSSKSSASLRSPHVTEENEGAETQLIVDNPEEEGNQQAEYSGL